MVPPALLASEQHRREAFPIWVVFAPQTQIVSAPLSALAAPSSALLCFALLNWNPDPQPGRRRRFYTGTSGRFASAKGSGS